MGIKHIGFQNLLYRKFISPGEHDAKKTAAALGESLSTFYNYCEGVGYCPPDLVARIYNATGDMEFLTFILNETDQMLTPRALSGGNKGLSDETLEVMSATGRLAGEVQKAVASGGISIGEANRLMRCIDLAHKELEDVRKAVEVKPWG